MATAGLDTGFFLRWLMSAADVVDREAGWLTELDSAIGDADHGSNLQRGFSAVRHAVRGEPPDTPGSALTTAGGRLVSTVGGASGPLLGTWLRRTGKALGSRDMVSREQLADALRSGVEGVAELGGAAAGDKTMLDALIPAVDALSGPDGSWPAARRAAEEGALATVEMQARKGRASYLGARSVGHQDPGAASAALLVAALADTAEAGEEHR